MLHFFEGSWVLLEKLDTSALLCNDHSGNSSQVHIIIDQFWKSSLVTLYRLFGIGRRFAIFWLIKAHYTRSDTV